MFRLIESMNALIRWLMHKYYNSVFRDTFKIYYFTSNSVFDMKYITLLHKYNNRWNYIICADNNYIMFLLVHGIYNFTINQFKSIEIITFILIFLKF